VDHIGNRKRRKRAKRNLKKMAEAVVETIPSDTMRTVSFTLCAENKGKE